MTNSDNLQSPCHTIIYYKMNTAVCKGHLHWKYCVTSLLLIAGCSLCGQILKHHLAAHQLLATYQLLAIHQLIATHQLLVSHPLNAGPPLMTVKLQVSINISNVMFVYKLVLVILLYNFVFYIDYQLYNRQW